MRRVFKSGLTVRGGSVPVHGASQHSKQSAGGKSACRPSATPTPVQLTSHHAKSCPGLGAGGPDENGPERSSASGPPQERSAGREAPALPFDKADIAALLDFFLLLDRWDREGERGS